MPDLRDTPHHGPPLPTTWSPGEYRDALHAAFNAIDAAREARNRAARRSMLRDMLMFAALLVVLHVVADSVACRWRAPTEPSPFSTKDHAVSAQR